jgi:hypothetical protein
MTTRSPHQLPGPQGGAFRPPAVGYGGVVASGSGLATAGAEMLLAGANVADAVAVAAACGRRSVHVEPRRRWRHHAHHPARRHDDRVDYLGQRHGDRPDRLQ